MSTLERRYRRLLIAYPRAYRMTYGEEMLGVLMDSAGPDQHHPSASDALHLLRHGLLSRARRLPSLPSRALRFNSPQWTQAASLFAFVGALLMTAKHAYLLAMVVGVAVHFGGYNIVPFPTDHLVLGCVWLATVVALVLRLSRTGAALAVIAVTGELVIAATSEYSVNAAAVMRVTAGVATAVAALLGRRTPVGRSWWMLGVVGTAALLAATGSLVEASRTAILGSIFVAPQTFYAGIAVLLALGWALLHQPGPVRRRLLVFGAAPVAQFCAYEFYDSGYGSGGGPALSLVPPGLTAILVCAAILGPGLTLLAVRRSERLGRLIALGREVEARNHTAAPAPPAE